MLKVSSAALTLKRSPVVHFLRVGTLALLSSRVQTAHSFLSAASSLFSVATPRSFASQSCHTMSSSAADTSAAAAKAAATSSPEDPYIWLEDVESEESLAFAMEANKQCLEALGDPASGKTDTYDNVLKVLESNDRIPHVTKLGRDEAGNDILYNFWKDKANPKGLWRKTTLDSYHSSTSESTPTEWTTVLNVDDLAESDGISWVWKGSTPLSRSRDPESDNGRIVTRALLSLSRGGSDAAHTKEFDMIAGSFVTDQPFNIPEAKTRASYKSRDVLLVGSDFGPDSLTDSGYPRTVREWVRGTDIADAPVVFEGDKKDVSVGAYIVDERLWGGGIYEVRSRSMTFYTSKYWMRKLEYEHLLAPADPARAGVTEPSDFVQVDIQEDAEVDFVGKLLLISLRSDWEPVPGGTTYKQGSVIYVEADKFLEQGKDACEYHVLFEPTERTAYEYFTVTKNYLVLSTMDNVKSKLKFYKIGNEGSTLTLAGGDPLAQIRDCSVRPLDPYDSNSGDKFWFTTSDFTTPSTLFLADASKVEQDGGDKPDAYITDKIKSLPPQFDSSDLSVAQQIAISKDGTEIPYFIIQKKDAVMNGKNPTLLYGYGGFEVSLGPHYIATAGLSWLERGGVYVEANIRGGGEFGPKWHQAALKANRNKAYEDFIAVGEHLISTGVCKPKSLAIRGGSNGKLYLRDAGAGVSLVYVSGTCF
jgi:prolyl oligopeptidase